MARRRIPVTVLTGFLGAGKTTLLRRVLTERHNERIAVMENEFGEISIDHELLIDPTRQQIIELNNGCICCQIRGDLVETLGRLREQHESGEYLFDRVIIETTGLADPAPIAQTFFVEDTVSGYYELDGILTVVGAPHISQQLLENHEAVDQVAFADRILVSKADLVSGGDLREIATRIRAINVSAPITSCNFGDADLRALLDIHGFELKNALAIEPNFFGDLTHTHSDGVTSFVYQTERDFDAELITNFFQELINEHGPELLRYKGILAYAGFKSKVVLQGVHMIMTSDLGDKWAVGEPRKSNLVFIGRELPEENLRERLDGCLANQAVPVSA